MKTILVTGCAGFIGSNFIYYYLKKYLDRRIIGLDLLTYAGNLDNLSNLGEEEKKRFTFVKGDINNEELVSHLFNLYQIDCVINFAAESHVDRSIYNPQIFLKTNILGTQTLLNVAKNYWYKNGDWGNGKKFIQISTDEVYGSLGQSGYFTEETPLDPHSPYSASKAAADLIVNAYYTTYKMPVCITRCSNNYGPYQFPEKLIPLIINNALNHQKLPVYGDGKQIRDWLYVEDHCNAIDLVLEKGEIGEIYNIGGNNEKENIYIVRKIIDQLQEMTCDININELLIEHVKDRLGHDRRYGIDSSKISNKLGWKPLIKFDEGIKKTIEWYLSKQEWMKKIISGEYKKYYERMYSRR